MREDEGREFRAALICDDLKSAMTRSAAVEE
jgi:hypothetical protein